MDINGNNQNVLTMANMVKKRIAVTVSEDLLRWVDGKVKDTTFANRSHAVERALTQLRENERKE
jgi:Arc/MetJ-type ribon-helix-helix transcriptional regulator